jgi:hypothetical protein
MSEQESERWLPIWDAWTGFRVSWDGNFYADERKSPSGRTLRAQPIATTTTDDGYVMVKYLGKDGKRVTRQAHRVVLENFAFGGAPIPEGLQSRHYDDRGTNNKWRPGTEEESRKAGGNLGVGDGSDQHRDKVRNNGGPLPVSPPAHDCINHERCGGKTRNPGKRCLPCVEQVGRDAAEMLRSGENLLNVAQHFNFTGTDWVFSLAQKHGYRGTKTEALTQRRKRSQRVAGKVRGWLGRGDAGSRPAPAQTGEAGTAPFGRPSPDRKVEQTGASWTPDVAQRDRSEVVRNAPKVTESDHPPYPADSVWNRPERTRGGTSRRSR